MPPAIEAPITIPRIGFGLWQLHGEEAVGAVRTAIESGYRLIDTAAAYGNEAEVGKAIRQSRQDASGVTVITKIWLSDFGRIGAAVDLSRARLRSDVLDIVLLHWPQPTRFEQSIRAWEALVDQREKGTVAAIGVSNFDAAQVDEIQRRTGSAPALNQVELHPYHSRESLRAHHGERGIHVVAHSPLGGPADRSGRPVEDPLIGDIAHRLRATPAQIVLAWHQAHGISPIPRSSRPSRIVENLASSDLALSPADVEAIDRLDAGRLLGPDATAFEDRTSTSSGCPTHADAARVRCDR